MHYTEKAMEQKKPSNNVQKINSLLALSRVGMLTHVYAQDETIADLRQTIKKQRYFIAALSTVLAVFLLKPAPLPKYFGQDTATGTFKELTPLSEPIKKEIEMRMWAEACIIDSLEINFLNPVKRLNQILSKCFDDNGKRAYQIWLSSGDSKEKVEVGRAGSIPADSELGVIIRKRQSVTASAKAPGRIIQGEKIKNDKGEEVARWSLTMPVLVRKEAGDGQVGTGNIVVKVELVRNTDPTFEKGVSISSWNMAVGD